jgi:acyl-CoA synthetase (NDP forming)
MVSGLDALLRPRRIAIVGANPRPDSLGGRPALNLAARGYTGRVFPVNPRYTTIGDGPCYPSLATLPEPPDLVLVLVGADRVFDTLDQALAAHARAAIVFGGGFAEVGGDGVARQQRLGAYGPRDDSAGWRSASASATSSPPATRPTWRSPTSSSTW